MAIIDSTQNATRTTTSPYSVRYTRVGSAAKQMNESRISPNPSRIQNLRKRTSSAVVMMPFQLNARTIIESTNAIIASIVLSFCLCDTTITPLLCVQKTKTSRTQPSRHSFRKQKVNETPGDTPSAPTTRWEPEGPWGNALKPSSLA
jgi:hypothetical protein